MDRVSDESLGPVTKHGLLSHLPPSSQGHLLAFWDRLTPEQQKSLAEEIQAIDYAVIQRLYGQGVDDAAIRALAARATPPPAIRLGDPNSRFSPSQARDRGQQALRAGQIGVILVAGGQGTRLRFNHPKGMFPIGPLSGKSLFQIHAEKILASSRRYGAPIPLYLMTSPATHDETSEFFAANDRFGLPEKDLRIFCQGTMPAVDRATGRILLSQPHQIALSPDGHGGMLAALARSGALADLRDRGIRHVFYFQVDNPLVDVCSPEFIGYHLLAGSEFTSEVVAKQTPADKVGNMVQVDGRLHVIEYSDLLRLCPEVAERRNPDGSLAIWAGSIAVHVMDVAFLERMAGKGDILPFHVAEKKEPYVDAEGRRVEPKDEEPPNAIKFERFIFDLLLWAENALLVEVDRALHFAPLKKKGKEEPLGDEPDTPEWVQARMVALHTQWLRTAGVEVAEGVPVEISPLVALDAEELAARVSPGMRITQATYLQ